MTPEEARRLLDCTTPGEWQWDETGNVATVDCDGWEDIADYVSESNAPLIVSAPTLAAMRAEMREEWAREARITGGTEWHNLGWCRSRAEAELTDWPYFIQRGATVEYQLVRRYVTNEEEIA